MTSKLFNASAALAFSLAVPLLAHAEPVCGTADLSKLQSRIYVAPGGSDGADCGSTIATACASIQHGIGRCAASGCGVLVRYGLYQTTAAIALRDGVGVYGSCVFDTTADPRYRTVVQATSAASTPAVSAVAIDTPTTVYGLVIVGKDETAPGTASVAMTVANSKGLQLRRTRLVSGNGAVGSQGATPGVAGKGQDGGSGGIGAEYPGGWGGAAGTACNPQSGGSGGGGSFPRQNVISGCGFWCSCTSVGGLSGAAGAASGEVQGGGGGGPAPNGYGCADGNGGEDNLGTNGGPGSPGACGTPGGQASPDIWGRFNAANWSPSSGGQGAPGAGGSGGGGAGAGGLCAKLYGSWVAFSGGPGGGGGGGGCGGSAGGPGAQGGASIPLVAFQAAVTIDQVSIVPGTGGRGGDAGSGGLGGGGGVGGWGSGAGTYNGGSLACRAYDPKINSGWGGTGGAGGTAGQGGAGSGAAGGNGGPSIGIALVGQQASASDGGRIIYAGYPGSGGAKGSGGQNAATQCKGADGEDGKRGGTSPVQQF